VRGGKEGCFGGVGVCGWVCGLDVVGRGGGGGGGGFDVCCR